MKNTSKQKKKAKEIDFVKLVESLGAKGFYNEDEVYDIIEGANDMLNGQLYEGFEPDDIERLSIDEFVIIASNYSNVDKKKLKENILAICAPDTIVTNYFDDME